MSARCGLIALSRLFRSTSVDVRLARVNSRRVGSYLSAIVAVLALFVWECRVLCCTECLELLGVKSSSRSLVESGIASHGSIVGEPIERLAWLVRPVPVVLGLRPRDGQMVQVVDKVW